jgi:RNA polymerase sigma-54 factor
MAQYLSQNLSQQMRLEQRLTPQLIQAMAVLQKPVAELETFINDALESNAALEVVERDGKPEHSEPQERLRADRKPLNDRIHWWERFSRSVDGDGDGYSPARSRRSYGSDDSDAKMGALANSPGREAGLQEHLLGQWGLLDFSPDVRRAGETIIQMLDPDGYLRVPLDEILHRARPPISRETFEQALKQVQLLEPLGIGARDLIECLLLQLETMPGDNRVERVLIERHLNDIAQNRLPAVAKATGYSLGEIQEALRVIRTTLHPHPGYLVGRRAEPGIRPDVIVDYADTGGGLTVRLARGNVPPLRINDAVSALTKSRTIGREERDFARKQVESAAAIIDAVQYRQNRLLEVSRAVVEKQRDFFDIGPEGLRVLRMTDLAQELGCDPSTISRTVADKYMQSPQGIFPLRYFFTGGRETDDGESIGWDRVKTRVKELVEEEDRRKPLKDDQIAGLLQKEGLEISRRTVAKYRQQLDIPNAKQRQTF